MKNFEVRFSKAAQGRRGSGQITWGQFSAMLRAAGILMEGQHLEKVVVDKKKITFTTDKTGNQK